MNPKSEGAVFPRSFTAHYPAAVRGEGVYVFGEQGKRYLDACGGAAVVAIGHGVGEVAEAVRERLSA